MLFSISLLILQLLWLNAGFENHIFSSTISYLTCEQSEHNRRFPISLCVILSAGNIRNTASDKLSGNFSLVRESCLTLCNPTNCNPPGSSLHRIFQARILKWVDISFSRVSSRPRDWTCISCLGRQILWRGATREALESMYYDFNEKPRLIGLNILFNFIQPVSHGTRKVWSQPSFWDTTLCHLGQGHSKCY